MNGQLQFQYEVAALKGRIAANRAKHKEAYDEAMEGWYLTIKEEAEKAVKQFEKVAERAGEKKVKPETLYFHIRESEPRNYIKDYDRVLDMLDMTTDTTVTLDSEEFGQYVRDEWPWSDEFATTSAHYTSNKRRLS